MEPETTGGPLALPFITPELPGLGGSIKNQPSHFVVDELPLYTPCGQGSHLYLYLEREGWTTRRLQQELARVFGLKDNQVGYAGLKDKNALVRQSFSLQITAQKPEEAARRAEEELGVKALSASRHQNKLKVGHLLGNRFRILLKDPAPGHEEAAQKIARALAERGLPNYFGPQRFGAKGDNAELGRQALMGKPPRQKWLRKLVLSAYQSQLFNLWLALRIEAGLFGELVDGDVAKKTDTGGMFTVEDLAAEALRFESGAISYTGPMFGAKMPKAKGQALEMERAALTAEGVDEELFAKARLPGGRRWGRLMLDDLEIAPAPEGLWFSFSLPKGSYATSLLREFMKDDEALRGVD